jgi:putative heme-binding domain-containing protein
VKETASWIAGRHPEWGGALAGLLRNRLLSNELPEKDREELVRQLARFARNKAVQDMLAERLADAKAPETGRRLVLQTMAQAGLKEAPEPWVAVVTRVVQSGNGELLRDAVTTARALHVPAPLAGPLSSALLAIGTNARVPEGTRLSALAAVPNGVGEVQPALFAFLLSQLAPDQPMAGRSVAADVVGHARLSSSQLLELADHLKEMSPMEVERSLEAFASCSEDRIGRALVAALKGSPARAGLRVETVKPRLQKFGKDVQKEAAELYVLLDAETAKQRVRLEQMLGHLAGGDVRRGQLVFNSPKAACAVCHAIGYMGGNVGPDLTHIGKIRTERDLLEAIVYPSASFVRSYEPVVVYTKAGRSFNGVIRRDAADEVVLATGINQEARIPRGDIEDIQPSKVSIMPAGLDQQLSPGELADLVAFLRACK